jgi:predicted dithiol-disulfide oxidoreductase (DUF899 family)
MNNLALAGASAAYVDARAQLTAAEDELKHQRERVAELRRQLPADTPVETDYRFTVSDGSGAISTEVPLADLFADPALPLLVIHFMWNPADAEPCPLCTMWADGYDGVVRHLENRANVVLVIKQKLEPFLQFADQRGWRNLRVASSHGTTFNRDFGMESETGSQMPGVSVFQRQGDATVSHFYTVSALLGDDRRRGLDLLTPVWNMFDLLPDGRGDFMPRLAY